MRSLPEPYAGFAERLGRSTLERRLLRQANHWASQSHQGSGIFRWEARLPLDKLVSLALRASGLAKRARANFLAPRVIERRWRLNGLPLAFEGFRLLQLSDLHLDLDPDFTQGLIDRVRELEYDAVAIPGS